MSLLEHYEYILKNLEALRKKSHEKLDARSDLTEQARATAHETVDRIIDERVGMTEQARDTVVWTEDELNKLVG